MSEKHVLKESLVVPPCRVACPAGIDVPRYIRRIKEGKFDEKDNKTISSIFQ